VVVAPVVLEAEELEVLEAVVMVAVVLAQQPPHKMELQTREEVAVVVTHPL
jgi:hypothetical protein